MKKLIYTIMLLLPNLSWGQGIEFSGYFENQFFPQQVGSEVMLQDYNKLRLDMSSEIGDRLSFSGDFIFQLYHGATTMNALDFLPDDLVGTYASSQGMTRDELGPMFDIKMEDKTFLDNAYVTLYLDWLTVRVGKQQLPWGAGYSWNPTDIFNDKNMLDPLYEKTGVNALKLELPYSETGGLTAVLSYGDRLRNSTKALKISDHFFGYDISLCYAEKELAETDYYTWAESKSIRRMAGANLSGELLGLGVWAEGAYNFMDKKDDYMQVLLGADYTFECELSLKAEYYHNGLGKSDYQDYDMNDWMRLMGSQGENLGRDYIMAGQSYPITELIEWSNFAMVNLSDGSFMFFPWISYSIGDNTELILVGYLPIGRDGSEFGGFGKGGFARLRVYI